MYGWIVDGISSLFEPATGQNPSEWPGRGNVSGDTSTRPAVRDEAQRQQSHGRAAKRNYQRSVVGEKVYFFTPLCINDYILRVNTHLLWRLIYKTYINSGWTLAT